MSPPPDEDPRRPRGAVRTHLRKLMAATAAIGLAAVTTRSGSATTPPLKTDAGVSDGGREASPAADAGATTASAESDGGADGDVDGAVPSCGPDMEVGSDGRCHGYAVVDPLPPPARGGCGCHKEPGMASGPDPEPVE